MRKYLPFLVLLPFIFPALVRAGLGVGVSTGKIIIDKPVKPGTVSILPPMMVMNTGDVPARYELGISQMQDQPELFPQAFWFSYNPPSFELAPGEAQPVEVTITLPLKVVPGPYFALLEAHPVLPPADGGQVGIAAASKLYFNVEAANIVAGIFYRSKTIWDKYAPYDNYLLAILLLLLGLRYASEHFGVTITKKSQKSH